MKSSPYDWDCLVLVPGEREEVLLSELPGSFVFCTRCECNIIKPKYVEHMMKYHDWKVVKGTI